MICTQSERSGSRTCLPTPRPTCSIFIACTAGFSTTWRCHCSQRRSQQFIPCTTCGHLPDTASIVLIAIAGRAAVVSVHIPNLPNAIRRDATWWEWRLKDWAYRRSNLTFITPSTWMYDLARRSMLNRFPIHHIPHGVDTDVYPPLDREMSRTALGIPPGKKVLLYLARRMNPSHKASHIKGADVLAQALQELPSSLRNETVLLLVGEGANAFASELDITTIPLGFLSSDRLKAIVYSARRRVSIPFAR